jgi:hypothetical protein
MVLYLSCSGCQGYAAGSEKTLEKSGVPLSFGHGLFVDSTLILSSRNFSPCVCQIIALNYNNLFICLLGKMILSGDSNA